SRRARICRSTSSTPVYAGRRACRSWAIRTTSSARSAHRPASSASASWSASFNSARCRTRWPSRTSGSSARKSCRRSSATERTVTFWITQALNGISFGMLLFLLAAGLSLIYGLMRMLNLAHGSYYILGGYVGLAAMRATGSFVLAALAATAVGLVMGLGLWWLQEGTRLGAMIRAGVDDAEMARGTGVNVGLLSTAVFALGAFLAGLGGIIGGPFVGVYPGADFEILEMALVVVIIGGLGSLKGAFVGGLVVGLLDNFGKALFPELALFTVFAPMAVILAL